MADALQIDGGDDVADPRAPRDMPAWLAVAVVLLCVGGGAYLLYWYFNAPPRSIAIPMTEPAQPRAFDGRRGGNRTVAPVVDDNWTDDIRALGAGNWNVRAGDAGLWVGKRQVSGAATLNLRPYYRNPLLTGADAKLASVPTQAQRRPEALANLALTPEQVQKLSAIRPVRGMKVDPADDAKLKELWAAYDAADDAAKPGHKAAVLAALKEVGTKSLEPTKQALTEQVAAVKAVLTPEQVAKVQ
ncbi:MAG TPA: hypothetical protein VK324_13445 [Tepidisphaeraceae bacterium]|nr:hypothetical protein [Tepidisphaeraceae bacterium]